MDQVISPLEIARSLNEYWSPKVISEVNDSYVKVAKLLGHFVWHDHQDEDEMFLILQGTLIIELRDKQVTLNTGDIYVIPKGIEHNPIAEEECLIMLFEKKSTLHTGNIQHKKTKSIEQQK